MLSSQITRKSGKLLFVAAGLLDVRSGGSLNSHLRGGKCFAEMASSPQKMDEIEVVSCLQVGFYATFPSVDKQPC